MNENHHNGRLLILLFAGVLMGALDISIVGPAIPSIEQTIQVDHKALSWIYSIYILFNLIGVSIFAKLSDLQGRRIIYIIAVTIFGIGSAVVAFSGDITTLLIGRAIQGFGSSGIFPVASAVVGDVFPPEKRGKAIGLLGAVFGMAFLVGPIIAGIMLKFFHWNSLFLINLPIAVVIIYFAWKLLPSHRTAEIAHFDWPGMILIAVLLAAFAYGINNINPNEGLNALLSVKTLPYFITALVSLTLFIFLELKSPSPVVKIQLFDIKQIRIVGIVAIAAGLIQSVTVFIPEMAVDAFKVTPSRASFMLIPFVIAIAIGSPLSGRMVDKIGSRLIVMTGLLLSALGLVFLYFSGNLMMHFYTGSILMGFGTSMLQGSSMRYIMLNEVRPNDRALGQGILTLFLSIGQMTGAALIGIMIASQAIKLTGYHFAFISIAVIALIIMLLSSQLKGRKAELVSASVAQYA
jgi:EmrB/QacA subfamily drug resistance transporter